MKKAFTLAEVLITLGVIGVVAAMTLPSLIQKHNEKVIVNQLKKVYSTFAQAYKMAEAQNGPLEDYLAQATNTGEGSQALMNYFAPYLNIGKNCGLSARKGCFPPEVKYLRLNGSTYGVLDNSTDRSKGTLSDGASFAFFANSYGADACKKSFGTGPLEGKACGSIYVDVNGRKNPNIQGIDYFSFSITSETILPDGGQYSIDTDSFEGGCKDKKTHQGWGCAAWVIVNENLDYLHCDDLDWNTKTKCK